MTIDETFNNLYEQNLQMVRKIVSSRLKQHQSLVDDTTQQVFLKVWSAMQKPTWAIDNDKMTHWIAKIAKTTSLDTLRKINKRHEVELTASIIEVLAEPPAEEPTDDTAVTEALETLTTVERLIIETYYYANQSVKQIAKTLRTPEGTIRRMLWEARQKLGEQLK